MTLRTLSAILLVVTVITAFTTEGLLFWQPSLIKLACLSVQAVCLWVQWGCYRRLGE